MIIVHVCRDIEYIGGVEIFLQELLTQNLEFRHLLVCTEGKSYQTSDTLRLHGVEVHYLSGRFHQKASALKRLIVKIQPDIVHYHLFKSELLSLFVPRIFCSVATKYCSYAMDNNESKGVVGTMRKYIYEAFVEPLIANIKHDAVVVINDELEEKWRKLKGNRVIRIPISHVKTFAAPRSGKKSKEKFDIVIASRLVAEKRHDILIAALHKISYTSVRIIGDGPLKPLLEYEVKLRKLDNVFFLGPLPHTEVLQQIALADVMVLTSETEGLPLLIQEAMSLGVPVLASDISGNKELIGETSGLLFKNKSVESLVACFHALEGKDLFAIGNEGIEKCQSAYNLKYTIEKHNELYRELHYEKHSAVL